jgi:DnaJ-class molecular chaperone
VARKTYYSILGIPRNEGPEGVRTAFRSLAKLYHPDRAAVGSAEKFREIHEAYEVLSDPRKRGAYDDTLAGRELRSESHVQSRPPRRRPEAEPLIARDAPRARRVLRAEVILTPAEADQGGVASLPLPRSCPSCNGTGGFGPLPCAVCSAKGTLPGEHTLRIRLPPMEGRHATYDFVLDASTGLVLHLDVRVEEH